MLQGADPDAFRHHRAGAADVAYTYDDDLQLSRWSLAGANPVDLTWDADGMLLSEGLLTLDRRDEDGRVHTATVGSAVTELGYDGF